MTQDPANYGRPQDRAMKVAPKARGVKRGHTDARPWGAFSRSAKPGRRFGFRVRRNSRANAGPWK